MKILVWYFPTSPLNGERFGTAARSPRTPIQLKRSEKFRFHTGHNLNKFYRFQQTPIERKKSAIEWNALANQRARIFHSFWISVDDFLCDPHRLVNLKIFKSQNLLWKNSIILPLWRSSSLMCKWGLKWLRQKHRNRSVRVQYFERLRY